LAVAEKTRLKKSSESKAFKVYFMSDTIQDNEEELQNDQQAGEDDGDLERQLVEAREEAKTNLAGWQRVQADFENYQKRKEVENKELVEFAREVAVAKLLPTLDSLGKR
jgi:molecular chaperone GrpE (heat shock protein)